MRIKTKLERWNYPNVILGFELLNSDYKAILTDGDFPMVGLTHDEEAVYDATGEKIARFYKGIVISPLFEEKGLTPEYFDTSIVGKLVYAPIVGCGQYLYTGLAPYIVADRAGTEFFLENDYTVAGNTRGYKRVNFTTETTLGDLYKNACCYSYIRETDCFEVLPEAGAERNRLEIIKELTTLREVGTLYSRIENMNILIHFLLSKAALTGASRILCNLLKDTSPLDAHLVVYNV